MYEARRKIVIRKFLFALTLLILLAGVTYSPSSTTYSANPDDTNALPGCSCNDNGIAPIPCYDYGGACGCPGGICQ